MELKNSYIFLKNPYRKEEKSNDSLGIVFGGDLSDYIKESFPAITKVVDYATFYKRKYAVDLQYSKAACSVEFIITEVVDTYYLDIVVIGKNKYQIVKCLEHIQYTLVSSGLRERYIDIISYDSVSEYYCNKVYPKLNTLERNLRKLLFNIYVVNFGRDYYKATVGEELQNKIKRVIKVDISNAEKEHIKTDYKTSSTKETEEIERLQRFFYSFEYNDIQKLLFTPSWTNADETKKAKFLDEQNDLSKLSDKELREAFAEFVPKSDWERFFSNKIDISDIKELIEQIRLYRNSVAHFKFFYKSEYDECNELIIRLNSAIINAIKITEEKDFVEKNSAILSEALRGVIDFFAEFRKSFEEMAKKLVTNIVTPAVDAFSKSIREKNWLKPLGTFSVNNFSVTEAKKMQELADSIKSLTALKDNLILPCINETQDLINHPQKTSLTLTTTQNLHTNVEVYNTNTPHSENVEIELPETSDCNKEDT